jgi:hypothetical protein
MRTDGPKYIRKQIDDSPVPQQRKFAAAVCA